MLDPIALLERRVRLDGAAPLLTYRGLDDAARVELSARTVANWADKICSALGDAGVVPGDRVALPVLARRPAHWGPLVWLLGAWQAGAVPTLDDADVTVSAPGEGGDLTCSLHPLGLGSDVLAYPDVHHRAPLEPVALVADGVEIAWRDVAVEPVAGRILVTAGAPWPTIVAALLAPLAGGGSAVLLDGTATPELAAAIADEERVG